MSDHQTQQNEAGELQVLPVVTEAGAPVNQKRRRFTTAGIAASGAILTLASRPVLGNGLCTPNGGFTISGWMSGNVSANHVHTPALGKSPGYWKHSDRLWPQNVNKLASFVTVFPSYKYDKDANLHDPVVMKDGSKRIATLIDVISADVFNDVFARSITCAYLNFLSGSPMRPNLAEIQAMAGKTFTPGGATLAWSEADIVCFLSQTFDGPNA